VVGVKDPGTELLCNFERSTTNVSVALILIEVLFPSNDCLIALIGLVVCLVTI
jgi:hypothetical protein